MKKVILAVVGALMLTVGTAEASIESFINGVESDIKQTYREGTYNMMVPLRVWHNRLTYDKEHIDKYNEEPWGFGMGLTRYDGLDWHGLYAVAFKDSNDYMQTMFGYAYLKNTALDCYQDWLFGYGYTLGLTQRHEYSYVPIPLPLPMVALTYRRFSLNATYVPGIKNDGNVLFTWLRYDF